MCRSLLVLSSQDVLARRSLPARGPWLSPAALSIVQEPMKIREVLRLLRDDGWLLVASRGSHQQFKHPTKPGRVTVAGHPSDDLAPKTLRSILDQAGFKER